MTAASAAVPSLAWDRLAQLRRWLELTAALRELDDPFASPAEFRKVVELVGRLGRGFGLDAAWLARLEGLLADDDLVAIVLAVVHYVAKHWSAAQPRA